MFERGELAQEPAGPKVGSNGFWFGVGVRADDLCHGALPRVEGYPGGIGFGDADGDQRIEALAELLQRDDAVAQLVAAHRRDRLVGDVVEREADQVERMKCMFGGFADLYPVHANHSIEQTFDSQPGLPFGSVGQVGVERGGAVADVLLKGRVRCSTGARCVGVDGGGLGGDRREW